MKKLKFKGPVETHGAGVDCLDHRGDAPELTSPAISRVASGLTG
jgi:hypothetical protein